MNRSTRQKRNKETTELTYTTDKMDLTDIHKTFHSTDMEYTFFSSVHGTFSRIDHIIEHKTSISKVKIVEIITCIFSNHQEGS